MRVALVGPYSEPGRAAGGVESSFVNLLTGLTALGDLELDVVTFTDGPAPANMPGVDGVVVHRLHAPKRLNNLTFFRARRRALARALDQLRPEIVHAQSALGYGYSCLKEARHLPVVVTVHGIARETRKLLTDSRDRFGSLASVAVERYCIRHAHYLLQPTTYPQEYFGQEIRGRIFEVGNAVPDSLFAIEPSPEPGRVLFAGALTPAKRVHDLIDVVARVPAAMLRIAGGGMRDSRYVAALGDRIRERGLENRLTLLGPLSAERMLDEYRRASVLVVPSAQETSPMAIAEAMAAGVPVVATRVGGIPHLVEEGCTGFLVEVGDTDALATRLRELLDEEDVRRAFAADARVRADRFRPAAVAARVRAVYQEAVR